MGRYRIGALLGEGGYGRVLQATQLPLEREVAIKVVNANDAELAARFIREAAIIQRLEHPNTVRVLDVGTTPSGDPFLVLELLRGRDLDGVLEQRGRLTAEESLGIAAQVLKSLAEAHEKGIVHRDIKPGNVFITSHFGEPLFVKVLDFGIAKQLGSGEKLTMAGETLGTPSYMSPEQAMAKPIDARTDLYAVGLMLAEMVTGRLVYEKGGPLTIVELQTVDAPVPLSDEVLASAVGPIVRRATQKDPAHRYQSAPEMLAAVEETRAALLRPPAPSTAPVQVPPASAPSAPNPTTALPVAPQLTAIHPSAAPLFVPMPPTATVPGPTLLRAPAAQRASKNRIAIVAVAFVGALLVTVLLAVTLGSRAEKRRASDETEETDEPASKRPRHPASAAASSTASARTPRPRLAPSHKPGSTLRSVPEMKRAFLDDGYTFSSVQEGPEDATIYTFMLHKGTCHGSVMRMVSTEEMVEEQARAIRQPHCRVVVDGLVIVAACFSGPTPGPCADAAAKLVVK